MQVQTVSSSVMPGSHIVQPRTFEAGVFLVDKPVGPSSFRMVQHVRRALGIKKVGHAGTLDPVASGLLIICAGRPATRHISRLVAGEKEYEATLALGVETDTLDTEGTVTAENPIGELPRENVEKCLSEFLGEQMQRPPQFSAVKLKGKPLYHYARQGIIVHKEPRRIEIKDINCLSLAHESLTIRVVCSKGTYIRVLAADIGKALGCGAHLSALRRVRSGDFSVAQALPGEVLGDRDRARELLFEHMMRIEDVLAKVTNNYSVE